MKYIWIAVLIIFSAMAAYISLQNRQINEYKNRLDVSESNVKALVSLSDSLKLNTYVLSLNIEELNNSKDSLVMRVNELRKENNIKDKAIKALEYQVSHAAKTDTLIFRDTLFRDPELKIDTSLTDKWYSLKLHLEYPSKIVVNPSFKSERTVMMSLKRETVKPEKKCWFLRLFQKKHDVMVVDVKEENPYINIEEQRYIKIIE